MAKRIENCEICLNYPTELHHIVFRSECKALENCELNHIYLCAEHHRGTFGIHGAKGNKLSKKLKLKFQNKLEMLFNKEYLTANEINEILKINDKALYRLLKTVKKSNDKYYYKDVIRACMGGKMILAKEVS